MPTRSNNLKSVWFKMSVWISSNQYKLTWGSYQNISKLIFKLVGLLLVSMCQDIIFDYSHNHFWWHNKIFLNDFVPQISNYYSKRWIESNHIGNFWHFICIFIHFQSLKYSSIIFILNVLTRRLCRRFICLLFCLFCLSVFFFFFVM